MTGEQIVYKATGRPAREVLAEEAAAGNYTRIEVAEQMGLTVPQMDALLYKHGIRWGYAGRAGKQGRRNQHAVTRRITENGERISLAEWSRRHGIPYSTAVKWHDKGVCEEKLAERLGRTPRPQTPATKSDPDAAWEALRRL